MTLFCYEEGDHGAGGKSPDGRDTFHSPFAGEGGDIMERDTLLKFLSCEFESKEDRDVKKKLGHK